MIFKFGNRTQPNNLVVIPIDNIEAMTKGTLVHSLLDKYYADFSESMPLNTLVEFGGKDSVITGQDFRAALPELKTDVCFLDVGEDHDDAGGVEAVRVRVHHEMATALADESREDTYDMMDAIYPVLVNLVESIYSDYLEKLDGIYKNLLTLLTSQTQVDKFGSNPIHICLPLIFGGRLMRLFGENNPLKNDTDSRDLFYRERYMGSYEEKIRDFNKKHIELILKLSRDIREKIDAPLNIYISCKEDIDYDTCKEEIEGQLTEGKLATVNIAPPDTEVVIHPDAVSQTTPFSTKHPDPLFITVGGWTSPVSVIPFYYGDNDTISYPNDGNSYDAKYYGGIFGNFYGHRFGAPFEVSLSLTLVNNIGTGPPYSFTNSESAFQAIKFTKEDQNKVITSYKCIHCQTGKVFEDSIKRHSFCGRSCGEAWRASNLGSPPPTPPLPVPESKLNKTYSHFLTVSGEQAFKLKDQIPINSEHHKYGFAHVFQIQAEWGDSRNIVSAAATPGSAAAVPIAPDKCCYTECPAGKNVRGRFAGSPYCGLGCKGKAEEAGYDAQGNPPGLAAAPPVSRANAAILVAAKMCPYCPVKGFHSEAFQGDKKNKAGVYCGNTCRGEAEGNGWVNGIPPEPLVGGAPEITAGAAKAYVEQNSGIWVNEIGNVPLSVYEIYRFQWSLDQPARNPIVGNQFPIFNSILAMYIILYKKFSNENNKSHYLNMSLKDHLLLTDDHILIERNEHPRRDNTWSDNNNSPGLNLLGELLMVLREQFRNHLTKGQFTGPQTTKYFAERETPAKFNAFYTAPQLTSLQADSL